MKYKTADNTLMEKNLVKIVIIVFSPTGNTLKIGEILKSFLQKKYFNVSLVNFTGRSDLLNDGRILKKYLVDNIGSDDLVCIGSPVYAGHIQYNVKKIIKSLPKPYGIWGKQAVFFVTYGGVSPGLAFTEAWNILNKTGRVLVLGMQINSFHCLTRNLDIKLNDGKPGDEALPIVEELACRIEMLKSVNLVLTKQTKRQFGELNLISRIIRNTVMREKVVLRLFHPKVVVDRSNCTACGSCISVCPVKCLNTDKYGKKRIIEKKCIHCNNCINNCKRNAIKINSKIYEMFFAKKSVRKNAKLCKSVVYPILNKLF